MPGGTTARRSFLSSTWLALRSLFWALLLPVAITLYVPWRFFGLRAVRLDLARPLHLGALALMVAGALVLGACIVGFALHGKGTLAPVDAPRHLVVGGPYRYVRNPMYLGVTTIVFGEFLLTHSWALVVYWSIWFTAVNLFVIGYEEPTLRRRFGAAYDSYCQQVGRWVPRRRPYNPPR